jgi:hypothetical protein
MCLHRCSSGIEGYVNACGVCLCATQLETLVRLASASLADAHASNRAPSLQISANSGELYRTILLTTGVKIGEKEHREMLENGRRCWRI